MMRCIVGPETERALKLGHPWVIADRFTAKWPGIKTGMLAELIAQSGEFLGIAMLDPEARIIARRLSKESIALNHNWVRERLVAAEATRIWLDFGDTTVWRMINAEGDGLPGLSVDRYGEHLLVQYYTKAWESHLSTVVEALVQRYAPKGVYAKYRPSDTRTPGVDQRSKRKLMAGEPVPNEHLVRENGLIYRVDLENELHTGLFPDQRENRRGLLRFAAGNKVLNLFAYTGAFSVAAATGGAVKVSSVDVADRCLARAKENFRLNGIDPEKHEFIVGDCFAVLKQMAEKGCQFDIVIMDPPSYSTTRKSRLTTRRGTAELIRLTLPLIVPGGLLICSSNLRKITSAEYLKELRNGAVDSDRNLRVIHSGGQAGDFPFLASFPEGQYLKYLVSAVL